MANSNLKASRKALIVAINDYPDGSANDLPSCIDDAKAMTELLKAAPYEFQEIRTHLDAEATIQNVTDSLNWLFEGSSQHRTQMGPDDRLVFYYSGHGFRTEQDGILRECLCLYDGFFFDKELNARTQNLPPGILTVILDSCHSGGMEKRRFNLLSSNGKAPVERVKIKAWTPDREELAKTDAAEEKSLSVKRFGSAIKSPSIYNPKAATKAAGEVPPEMAGETQVNGLMITACREDQTASASSSQTEGKSAFTFCLLNAFKKLGSQSSLDQLSSSKLFESVAQELEALQFRQTPELIESPNSPGLGSRSFVTLQAIDQIAEGVAPATSFNANATTTQPSTTTQGDKSMYTNQMPNYSTPQVPEADEKFWGALAGAAIGAAPEIYRAIRGKEAQPGMPGMPSPQASTAQPQSGISPEVINQIVQALQQAPQQPQTIPGKDFQSGYGYSGMGSSQPIAPNDKSWYALAAAAVSAVPSVIRAVRGKDYQPGDPEDERVLKAVLPALMPAIAQSVNSQGLQPGGYGYSGTASAATDDKSWYTLAAAAIGAAPEVYRAIRGKEAQPGMPGMPSPQAPFAQSQAIQSQPTQSQPTISPEMLNQIMQAVQQQSQVPQQQPQTAPGKDFQAGYGYSGMATPQPVDEKFWPLVIGAASAIPGVVRAIRGKEYQPGDPEDEQVLKAVLPALLPTIAKQFANGQYRPANDGPHILPYPAPNPTLAR